ncbi:CoA-transferase family III domain-containing protein [Leptodontidium sp. 2 PMI_412]|nr:CoA-transferase family III domain-containing protein [Leptodontidium sp. MPI-SDFR-AT-0119]KAH9214731.1 CoA-transferase family III domain-containing protein [Leptodontidium sp. 2 PMI_412]
MTGPPALTGIRVLEFGGLAPGPFAGLLLADNGASVLRIDRAIPNLTHSNTTSQNLPPPTNDLLTRHKSSIAVDLKSASGVEFIKSLIPHTDVVIDPFRPGILEKLGLGPDVLLGINPRIIIGRMTGFRRDGKYKDMAGHDINYIAVSGALALLGRKGEKPIAPGNILGDFAGGGAILFQGILLALMAREKNGKGQVVEANMVDGASYLATFPRMMLKTPMWDQPRGENVLDTGCPWYDTYETKDGKYMSVGALEPQFFAELLKGLGLAGKGIEKSRFDRETWPELKGTLERIFKGKTRKEWEMVFDKTDACCTPVLEYWELETDPSREGDQRPAVTLRETPSLAVSQGSSSRDASIGQGPGIGGGSYSGTALYAGEGGEDTLNDWLGWKRGKDFEVENGGLVRKASSKL